MRADLFAAFACAVVKHHLGAKGAGVVDLQLRRVRGHDYHGRDAMGLRGGCDTLRMIAAGIGQHATFAGALVHCRERCPAAPEFERSSVLQAFGFDQQATARNLVEEGRG